MKVFLLDKNETAFKILDGRNSVFEAIETIKINEAFQVDITAKLTQSLVDLFDRTFYLAIPIEQDSINKVHLYHVSSVKNDNSLLSVTAIEAAYDDLAAYGYIKDKRYQDEMIDRPLADAIAGTRWKVGYVPDLGHANLNFYYENPKDCISDIKEAFGAEFQFVYTFDGNKITGRTMNCYAHVGVDTGKRFVYGSKALSVSREVNQSALYTALVGRGKGEEVSDGSENASGKAGYGRKINFGDIIWSKAKGDPVDKPAGQEYVELPSATAKYGYSDGTPRLGFVDFEDETDKTELLKETYESLIDQSRPLVQFTASVTDVGDLNIGDQIMIIRHDIAISYKARVTEIKRNLLDNKLTTVTIGDQPVKDEQQRDKENVDYLTQVASDISDYNTAQLHKSVFDNIEVINNDIDDANKKIDQTQQYVDDANAALADFKVQVSDWVSQGGEDIIRFYPNRDKPTDIYAMSDAGGRMQLNSRGFAYWNGGTLKTAITNQGDVTAEHFAGNLIDGVEIRSAKFTSGSISGDISINLSDGNTNVVSLTRYGISSPNATIYQIDGVRAMNIVNSGYLMIAGAELTGDGSGKLYMGGLRILNESDLKNL